MYCLEYLNYLYIPLTISCFDSFVIIFFVGSIVCLMNKSQMSNVFFTFFSQLLDVAFLATVPRVSPMAKRLFLFFLSSIIVKIIVHPRQILASSVWYRINWVRLSYNLRPDR